MYICIYVYIFYILYVHDTICKYTKERWYPIYLLCIYLPTYVSVCTYYVYYDIGMASEAATNCNAPHLRRTCPKYVQGCPQHP